ncbi:MAG: homoserine O-succinyltransferase [Liquorilactobacillus ghanensis]|uniref:homoserine O-acetyltransferase/O-succinyltransferase family protein n=1 Tax=Liquorilactobacillus ghanensis TaxID=399370 RepID=UPI0039ED2389
MNKNSVISILVLNLMPDKAKTQQHLTSLFTKSGLTIKATFCYPATHRFRTKKSLTDIKEYVSFPEVKAADFDGLIVTGAAIEQLPFEAIDYWQELCEIFNWAQTHCRKVLTICWAAQAGMYYFGGVEKHLLNKKVFGIYPAVTQTVHPLLNGFSQQIILPFSRYTTNYIEEVAASPLKVLADSAEAGPAICATADDHNYFVTGHPEYQLTTLLEEYQRDQQRQQIIAPPENYFINDNAAIINSAWLPQTQQLFKNWFGLLEQAKVC